MRSAAILGVSVLAACNGETGRVHNSHPEIAIVSPSEGTELPDGDALVLVAELSDAESPSDALEVRWSSSLDGPLQGEASLADDVLTFTPSALSAGDHQIEALVIDPSGAAGYDTVSLQVLGNQAPSLSFLSPAESQVFSVGEVVRVELQVGDDRDDPTLVELAWTGATDGQSGVATSADSTGVASFLLTDLEPGSWTLSVVATDSDQATATANTFFEVSGDADGDGYESSSYGGDDCDDTDPAVNPDAVEVCDGVDNDCDGQIDPPDAQGSSTWYADTDGDGFGDPSADQLACDAPQGFVADNTDCDDGDPAVNPGATELCNGVDDDCDGTVDGPDADDASDWYADADSDGYGDASVSQRSCTPPQGYSPDDQDCDDTDPAVNPSATELCNGVDDDCDGSVDPSTSSDAATWYADGDSDGYGDPNSGQASCAQPSAHLADSSDCDDTNAAVNPAATELCNTIDDDCDGSTDEPDAADATDWYADGDSDGYGDPSSSQTACNQPSAHVADDTDCDDSAAAVNPGASEECDGLDNDCDGAIDDADSSVDLSTASDWYADGDSDGYGDTNSSQISCAQPTGFVADDTDCDDGQASTHPGANETCNSVDDDCDGSIDEDPIDGTDWAVDGDGDGYGDASSSVRACTQPSGTVADATDCDDSDDSVHPGAEEVCDGVDNDCDGSTEVALEVPSVYATINDALAVAVDGDRICVAPGTYSELLTLSSVDVVIEGSGGAAVTLIDGGGSGPVVSLTDRTTATELIGLTLTGGVARRGAGLYADNSAALLQDLVITNNACAGVYTCEGAGMYLTDSPMTLEGVEISSNSSVFTGAVTTRTQGVGANLYNSDATFTDVDFLDNLADHTGCTGAGSNSGDVRGGVLYMSRSDPTFERTRFVGNQALTSEATSLDRTVYGGVIWANMSDPTFTNTTITDNETQGYVVRGGVIVSVDGAHPRFTNLIVANNQVLGSNARAIGGVGYIITRNANMTVINADITGNGGAVVNLGGGGFFVNTSSTSANTCSLTLTNVNFVDNTWTVSGNQYGSAIQAASTSGSNNIRLTYNNFYGTTSTDFYNFTPNHYSWDPLYTDVSASLGLLWDLSLQSSSSSIDNGATYLSDVDGTRSDIGAYGGPGGASW